MKFIYKTLIVCTVLLASSCSLTELDLLDSPNAVTAENADVNFVFNSIQIDFRDFFRDINNLTSRPVRHLGMTGGNIYENAIAPNSGVLNNAWSFAYAGLLPDLDQLIAIADDPEAKIPAYAGAGKAMKAYVLMTLVDMFGEVPLTEAGQGVTVPSPVADSQESVYAAALALLDAAAADLQESGPNIADFDLYYGGNQESWLALVNTLKIKYYLNVGDASGINTAAGAGIIDNAALDFQFQYSSDRENFAAGRRDSRHDWYADGYEVGPNDYQSNYFMWSLYEEKGFSDPRLPYYFYRQDLSPVADIDAFTLDCGQLSKPLHYSAEMPFCHLGHADPTAMIGYWGRDHGNDDGIPPDDDRRTVAGAYPAGGQFDEGQGTPVQNGGTDGLLGAGIAPIMLSSFTHFMLAEAALTLGTSGDAAALLEEGIRQSMSKVASFGPAMDAAEVDSYVTYVMDNFNAAGADGKLDILMKEYHIALWGNALEAYNGYRRTTFPSNLQPTLEVDPGTFPTLWYYPSDYINLNQNSGDQRDLGNQAFWDTNPAGVLK